MKLVKQTLKLIFFVNVIRVNSDEQNLKTPILKIMKDENSIVAMGLQKSFSKQISYFRAQLLS